jgi:hypothetical protein
VFAASLAELVRTTWQVKIYQYYLYLLVHYGPQLSYEICSLACEVETVIPEKEHFILESSIANGGDDSHGDHSEVSHFLSVRRYPRSDMWLKS